MNIKKIDIFHNAFEEITNLTKTSDLEFCEWDEDNPEDRIFEIEGHSNITQFKVKIIPTIHKSDVIPLIEKLKNQSEKIIVAKQISSTVKELLRAQHINYLDEAGNCYIYHKDLFLFIEGQKSKVTKNKHINVFSKNGVILIFNLLAKPNFINLPQRDIAKEINISVGSVSKILKGLENANFLKKINHQEKKLINKKELLNRWVSAYNEKLKPKLFRGKYRFINSELSHSWENLELPTNTFWGGEPSARLLVKTLKPQNFTLYSTLEKKELFKTLKIVPDNINGNIDLIAPFEGIVTDNKQISPIITYADLVMSFDSRNIETAQKIYENYVKNIIE